MPACVRACLRACVHGSVRVAALVVGLISRGTLLVDGVGGRSAQQQPRYPVQLAGDQPPELHQYPY